MVEDVWRLEALEERVERLEDLVGQRLAGLDERGTSYSRVLNQRVEGLCEAVQRGQERTSVLGVGVFLQVLSFVGAVAVLALEHVRWS